MCLHIVIYFEEIKNIIGVIYDIYIGNICIPFINKIYEYFAIRRELLKQLKKNPNASLLIFSLHTAQRKTLSLLFTTITISLIYDSITSTLTLAHELKRIL